MIIGDRVNKIEAEIKERKAHEGLSLNILLKDVREAGKNIEFDYVYVVEYKGVGKISIHGTMVAEEEGKQKKKILDEWKKNKKVPNDYMERLLNAINFAATAHATIVARVLSYAPPLIPPKLSLKKSKA